MHGSNRIAFEDQQPGDVTWTFLQKIVIESASVLAAFQNSTYFNCRVVPTLGLVKINSSEWFSGVKASHYSDFFVVIYNHFVYRKVRSLSGMIFRFYSFVSISTFELKKHRFGRHLNDFFMTRFQNLFTIYFLWAVAFVLFQ